MHEMSLASGVIGLLEEAARREGFSRVKTVWLEIGALACVEPEALAFCFESVARGSLAEGAGLEIVHRPGEGWCMPCGRTVELAARFAECPVCGTGQVQVTGGEQMRVMELSVE